ncbi:hypothetical protein [Ewingella americana]|uniref:hypothetical protein n=1 Tax=Ewingella americana TaxID=41202 RepID=UPI0012AE00CD|nr:hypothetical protein [Ewingella americana]MRT05962.1 hypothetical protein [Ewingella americana]
MSAGLHPHSRKGHDDDVSFDEDKNTWLLTLPEIGTGARYLPACTIVAIRTVKESYFPQRGDENGKQQLTERTCNLFLSWINDERLEEMNYIAKYKVVTWDRTSSLDLTNSDFLIDYNLRGRGLGSWIMQQLICWARTLPEDTPVRRIKTSPVDEDEEVNALRRDRLWHGIGFRFCDNSRFSEPLHIRDLRLPQGGYSLLRVTPLHKGVAELAATCEKQKRDLGYLELARTRQADTILSLTERQWHVVLTKGLRFFLLALFSPLLLAHWLYGKALKNKTEGQA